MSKEYPDLLKRFTFQKIREVWISNDFLKFIYQISIKFLITNTLLHKFFQTDMILFDQFEVPTIRFGKRFADLSFLLLSMIPIALLKKFGS